jgi:hypothetical protein
MPIIDSQVHRRHHLVARKASTTRSDAAASAVPSNVQSSAAGRGKLLPNVVLLVDAVLT